MTSSPGGCSAPRASFCSREDEQALWSRGFNRVAGVDEVGRGPLAGPVVAAAVILPATVDLPGITDSKQLTDKQRRTLLPAILQQADAIGVGMVDADRIDRINILQASFEAMLRALARVTPDAVLVDGRHTIPGCKTPQSALVKGDSRSVAIAAASIIAKVWRDDLMTEYDRTYRRYGFARHKGYATASHFAALDEHGPCAIHRQTFLVRWRERKAQGELELAK